MNKFLPGIIQIVALAALVAGASAAKADEKRSFVIAAADGYGVEDCLAEPGECGKAVADAWCEAHGDGAALDFGAGPAIARKAGADLAAAAAGYVIICGP